MLNKVTEVAADVLEGTVGQIEKLDASAQDREVVYGAKRDVKAVEGSDNRPQEESKLGE